MDLSEIRYWIRDGKGRGVDCIAVSEQSGWALSACNQFGPRAVYWSDKRPRRVCRRCQEVIRAGRVLIESLARSTSSLLVRAEKAEARVKRAEATIPWTSPGMEWFTLFWPGPEPKARAPQKLFTCGDGGTHCVCTLGPEDYVFVGRGKKPNVSGEGRQPACSVSEYPLWAVMLAHTFEKSLTGPMGLPVRAPAEGPHGFIPLFFTREQAVAWAGGDEQVAELTPNAAHDGRQGVTP